MNIIEGLDIFVWKGLYEIHTVEWIYVSEIFRKKRKEPGKEKKIEAKTSNQIMMQCTFVNEKAHLEF